MNRYDYVGSFLRPERLKKARRDFENNTITIRCAVSERFIDNDKDNGLEKYIKVPKNGKDLYDTTCTRGNTVYDNAN